MAPVPEPWERQLRYVHSLVRADPWAADPEDPEDSVIVSGHARGISVRRGAGDRRVDASLEGEEWYLPLTRQRGAEIADRLLQELREKWELIPRPGPDGRLAVPELGIELAPSCWLGRALKGVGRKIYAPGQIQGASAEEAVERG